MKKTPMVFVIPILILIVVVAVAFMLKTKDSLSGAAGTEAVKALPGNLSSGGTKPSGGFTSGTSGSTQASSTNSASALQAELNSTVDDGGKSDLDQLAKESVGL